MSFNALGLQPQLLRAIQEQNYTTPTAVQTQAIPAVLAGDDVVVSAQTGTGKTAAFTLPLLQRLMQGHGPGRRRIRTLVLTPTRELAAQVADSVRTYGRHLPLRCGEIYGGVSMQPQLQKLRQGLDILVATPGRLIDHLERGTVDLSGVEILVLDEADRMLDMGFMPAIERIVRKLPAQRQTLLFSATFSATIRKLAQRFLRDPTTIETARANAAAETVAHAAFLVDTGRKRELLTHLIGERCWHQVLVFTRTKHGADKLARQLDRDGIRAAAIHGNKNQNQRTRALDAFKRRSVQVLVATDVAARGLDIDQLPTVVNYDMPTNPEDYVHRIGRTGRAGQTGDAVSLVAADERGQLAGIRRLVGLDIRAEVLDGYQPTQSLAAEPGRPRRNGGRPMPNRAQPSARPKASRRPTQRPRVA